MKIITNNGIFMADNFIRIDAEPALMGISYCILGRLPNSDYPEVLGAYDDEAERDYAYYRICIAVGNNEPSVDISTNNWILDYAKIRQEMQESD